MKQVLSIGAHGEKCWICVYISGKKKEKKKHMQPFFDKWHYGLEYLANRWFLWEKTVELKLYGDLWIRWLSSPKAK